MQADQVTNTPSAGRAKAINQNCAVNSGCFADDPKGFPVTISQPGSYQLTSNLDVRGEVDPENVTAIEILPAGVTLDLAGHQILGPVRCTGTPVTSCVPSDGTGHGIHVRFSGTGAKITNGTVRGAGRSGIQCDADCWVDAVAMIENAHWGIDADVSVLIDGRVQARLSRVSRSQAIRNGGDGISIHGLVSDSLARGNFLGIRLNGKAGMVVDSVASGNANGIAAHTGTVRGNTVFDNTDLGLFCNGSSRDTIAWPERRATKGLQAAGAAAGRFSRWHRPSSGNRTALPDILLGIARRGRRLRAGYLRTGCG